MLIITSILVLLQSEDRQKAGIAWARIRAALDVLGVSPEEQYAIWCVLAAIYHLGTAGATRGERVYLCACMYVCAFIR